MKPRHFCRNFLTLAEITVYSLFLVGLLVGCVSCEPYSPFLDGSDMLDGGELLLDGEVYYLGQVQHIGGSGSDPDRLELDGPKIHLSADLTEVEVADAHGTLDLKLKKHLAGRSASITSGRIERQGTSALIVVAGSLYIQEVQVFTRGVHLWPRSFGTVALTIQGATGQEEETQVEGTFEADFLIWDRPEVE